MKPIRLAMIQCDGHAEWYAPLIAPCDALKLRELSNCTHYFVSDLYFPSRVTAQRVAGFDLVKVWDANFAKAGRFAAIFQKQPRVCRTLEEATENIDAVFIAECDSDGSKHLEWTAPFLRRGIPVFVDKPFALTTRDARAMAALARKHKAPLFSSSILGFVPEVEILRAAMRAFHPAPTRGTGGTQFQEEDLSRARFGVVRGCWGWTSQSGLEGVIHGLTLAQGVFGPGVESVQSIGEVSNEYMVLRYKNGLEVAVLNHPFKNAYGFTCEIFTGRRYPYRQSARTETIGDPSFVEGAQRILRAFKRMIQTGKPPLPYESIIELIATAEAGSRSQKLRRRVKLSEI